MIKKIVSLLIAVNMIFAFAPVFAEDVVFENDYVNYTSDIAPTEAEKERAKDTFEGYIEDIATFPVSMNIGGVSYVGFGKDFTLKNTEKSKEGKAENVTLTITHKSGLEFTVYATFYPDYSAYKWTIYFSNPTSENSEQISDIKSLDIILEGEKPVINGSYGDDGRWQPLVANISRKYEFSPESGRSSDTYFPYYNITYGNQGMYMAVGWSGEWLTTFEPAGTDKSRVTAGQKTFDAYLLPGETLRTTQTVILLYDGLDEDRAINLWRHWFIDCHMPKCGEDNSTLFEPMNAMCMSGTFHEMTIATEGKILDILQKLLDNNLYFEWLWMDAGWYYGADGESQLESWGWGDLGSWLIDTKRFPTKLKAVTDFAKANGYKGSLLWFEYTRTHEKTDRLKDDYSTIHKDFLLNGSSSVNIGKAETVEWLINRILKVLEEGGISLFREDVNSNLHYVWQGGNSSNPGRAGVYENQWMIGKYQIWDAIREYTKLPIDTCASGGHILDIETLGYAVPLHQSDYSHSDMLAKQCYHLEMAKWMPYFGSSALPLYTSADKYNVRSSFAPFICYMFNASGDFDHYMIEELLEEKNGLKNYYYTDYYALTPWSLSASDWIAWEYYDDGTDSGYAQFFRRDTGDAKQVMKLKGLDPEKDYHIWFEDRNAYRKLSGKVLMEEGIEVTLPTQKSSDIMYIKTADGEYVQRDLKLEITEYSESVGASYGGTIGECIKSVTGYQVLTIRSNMSITGASLEDMGYIVDIGAEQSAKLAQNISVNGVVLADAVAESKDAVMFKEDIANNMLLVYLSAQYFSEVDKNNEVVVTLAEGISTYEGIETSEKNSYIYIPSNNSWNVFENEAENKLKIMGYSETKAESIIKLSSSNGNTEGEKWSVDNESVAIIGSDGTLIALGEGEVIVTLESDGQKVQKKVTVTQTKRDIKFGVSGLSKSPKGIFLGE